MRIRVNRRFRRLVVRLDRRQCSRRLRRHKLRRRRLHRRHRMYRVELLQRRRQRAVWVLRMVVPVAEKNRRAAAGMQGAAVIRSLRAAGRTVNKVEIRKRRRRCQRDLHRKNWRNWKMKATS